MDKILGNVTQSFRKIINPHACVFGGDYYVHTNWYASELLDTF